MSETRLEKWARLVAFGRAWDDEICLRALCHAGSLAAAARSLGLEVETVRAVFADREARWQRHRKRALA